MLPTLVGAAEPPDRKTSKQLARLRANLDARTNFNVEVVNAQAEVEGARMQSIAYLSGVAQHSVAVLNATESLLMPSDPHQAARLRTITDMGAVSLGTALLDAPRRLK